MYGKIDTLSIMGIEALVILILISALIYAQPASFEQNRVAVQVESTQVAMLAATVASYQTQKQTPLPSIRK